MRVVTGHLCVAAVLISMGGCGRVGYELLELEGSAIDAASIDAGPSTLADESLILPEGWSAEVWFDYSEFFTFDANDYLDDGLYTYSNRPHHMFLLSAPFVPGLGLMGNQEILELKHNKTFARHDYFQVLPGGPDLIWDAQHCGSYGTVDIVEGLCVAAGSQNAGDGVFRIESDWSMAQLNSNNNATVMAYDAAGAFDNIGQPTLYWGSPNGLSVVGGASVYGNNMNGGFARLLEDGNILLSSHDSTGTEGVLIALESVTHQEQEIARTTIKSSIIGSMNKISYAIVEGERFGFPGVAHVIEDGKRLSELGANDTLTVIAETAADEDWIWVAAVSPGEEHMLAAQGPAFYILEFNPTSEVNRIIRLAP